MSNPDQPANHLRDESSPYLLQHAHNPVNWYPWGEEALERARREDKPILLSIGYAACHWCHVMERESFENAAIARQMNEHFVSIKVDREERPDLDDIYMRSVQMMSGHGGWPLTVFLTPDLEPFAGGTYFPPEDRPHMPGFPRVLEHIAHTWSHQRDKAVEVGNLLTSRLGGEPQSQGAIEQLDHEMLHRAAMELHDRFDPNHGGFGPAPKFPNTTWVTLLLRYAHAHHDDDLLTDATFTLDSIAAGGIRDHVGGGFHRYATDARWLIPHFEKMLYDNALLVVAYLDALQITGDPRHGRAAATALDWVRREMQAPDGGYYSTLDADSESVEGKYYVWDRAEIVDLLGADAEAFCNAYGVVDGGNWEGVNILHHPRPLGLVAAELEIEESQLRERLASCLDRLRASRDGRVRPALDDKVLADWNGMMIAAMARAYRVLDRPDFLASAIAAATFVCEKMMPEGRLLHAHRHGKSYLKAYLDDYATMLWACVELFESTFDPHWLAQARTFADGLLDLFADDEAGGFFFTGRDHEALIARLRAAQDGATPSGNAIAATWLQRLAVLSGDQRYDDAARDTLSAFAATLRRAPFAFAQLLIALDQQLAEPSEIVVVGDASSDRVREALRTLWRRYSPTTAVVLFDPLSESAGAMAAALPLLEGKAEAGSDPATPTFFRCRGYSCEPPTDDLQAILG